MATLKIGTKLGGYQLLGLVARGGMGAVYEALEVQLERRVALKVIAPPNPDDHDAEELVQRFMQEARTLARVNHPNVITIYAIDTANSVPFITMEMVEGVSFKELLNVSYLSADLATPMFIQMLEGLQCLHDNRIVHRDLKPHNVMVRVDGQIKILDFGIAKPVDSGHLTHVGVVVGSLAYMAPEVKVGVAATERSDLWNLGAIFYECLTGKALPKVMSENGNLKEVPYPSNSPIPVEMRAIIAKLCAFKPLERYESAIQAVEELRRFQRSRPPLTADAMQAFSRKVQEIIAKRKTDSKDTPTVDITPVQANTQDHLPAVVTGGFRREREYTPRPPTMPSPKAWQNPRWIVVGALTLALALIMFLKNRSAPPVEVAVVEPPVPKLEEAVVRFEPPPIEEVTASSNERPQAEPVVLVEPADKSVVWMEPSAVPTLTWSQVLKANEYEIQIATDKAFRRVMLQEPVSGNYYRPARVLPEDQYYWRLVPKAETLSVIGPSHFSLAHVTAVDLIAPANAHVQEISAKDKAVTVDFAWKCKAHAMKYQLQITNSGKFGGPMREITAKDCDWREKNLVAGVYRWRVRVLGDNRLARRWSEVREFELKKGVVVVPVVAQPSVGKPILSESTGIFTLRFKNPPRDLASVGKSLNEFPELRWQPVKTAQKYLLQISLNKEFTKLQSEHILAGTKFDWKNVLPGVYYWRVAGLSATAPQGPYSDSRQLKVMLPMPRLKSRYKFEMLEGDRQVVSWPTVPLASKYLVQFDTKRSLAEATEQAYSQPRFALPTKHGVYFLKVAAANAAGEAISSYSATAAVELEPVAVMDPPEARMPANATSAAARGGRLSVTFEWTKIPKAQEYKLELAYDEDFAQVLDRYTTHDTSMVIKKVDVRGRIYWRVRGENSEGTSTWSEPRYFEVRK